jgi:putative tryptophan/tyrosine transport system substrate-binding protein
MGVTDPIGAGVARSIKEPGIATGSSDLCPFSNLLQVTRQLLPNAKTIGLPYNPSDEPAVFGRSQLIALAPEYGFSVLDRQVTSATELNAAGYFKSIRLFLG